MTIEPDCFYYPETNFDRIQGMTVEELAEFLTHGDFDCSLCSENGKKTCDQQCTKHCKEWLESEVDSE